MSSRSPVEPLEGRALLCGLVGDESAPHDGDALRRAAASLASVQAPIRIEAGNTSSYTDTAGKVWSADRGFTTSSVGTSAYDVAGTSDDKLYYTRRWGSSFSYRLPVENGTYNLRLLFADPVFTSAGSRVFHVSAEGTTLLRNFDIAANGGGRRAITRSFSVNVSDGVLHLAFVAVRQNAIISAIELVQTAGPSPGSWQAGPSMPVSLAEVAGGVIGDRMYVVGQTNNATLAYNFVTKTWTGTGLAQRPFPGNHHPAEVVNGKLYLFGGLDAGSPGKVQIYDPAANRWTLGRDMPFAAGSSSSALINGKVYVAGGIIVSPTGSQTGTTRTARYDPATDIWTELAPMPADRNHTASATDGQRLYVFGGRDGPNRVANGHNTVFIYNPATNQWTGSHADATIPALPQARGGMGKAAFFNGEFFVFGGETLTGAGATADGVYKRVDIYHPTAKRWRRGTDMITARHGMFPLLRGGQIFVAGGGVKAGFSASAILEIYNPV